MNRMTDPAPEASIGPIGSGVVSREVVQELWVSGPPERPSGVWRYCTEAGC
jgi:hypothetical protein